MKPLIVTCAVGCAMFVTPRSHIPIDTCLHCAVATRAAEEFPRRFEGWIFWRCWDEAQRITIDLDRIWFDTSGRIAATGREHYDVGHRQWFVTVELIADLSARHLTVVERDPLMDADAQASPGGPFLMVADPHFRKLSPISSPGKQGCAPLMQLVAE